MKRIAAALAATLVTLTTLVHAETTFSFDIPVEPFSSETFGAFAKLNLTVATDDFSSKSFYGEDISRVRLNWIGGFFETALPLERRGPAFVLLSTDANGAPTLTMPLQPQGGTATTYFLIDETLGIDARAISFTSDQRGGRFGYLEWHNYGPYLVSEQAAGILIHGVLGDVRSVVSEPPIALLTAVGLLIMRPLSRQRRRT